MNINIVIPQNFAVDTINITISPGNEAPPWAVELLSKTGLIIEQGKQIMASVADIQTKADDTLANVKAETDVVAAVKLVVDHMNEMIATLKQQLADAVAAGADPAALQTLSDTLDAIQAANTSNTQVVADAVAAGTPVETPKP